MRNRKDSKPEETIKEIKKILAELGMGTHITEMHDNGICYSVRVELSDFPGIGTNGKGITQEYALASAYGEFMERLENGALIDFLYPYKERGQLDGEFAENVFSNFCGLYGDMDNKKRNDLKDYVSSYRYLCEGRRYVDIINDRSLYLPFKLIDILCGTNGFCAGNTFEEAVVQGIGEIFERAVLKCIFFEPEKAYHEIKIMPPESYENLEIYEAVKVIENRGYVCRFLDCTMGGRLPVIALLMYDRKRVLYKFSIASDVELQIVMQRCITEIFQGQDFNSLFRMSMNPIFNVEQLGDSIFELKDVRSNFEKCAISGSGQLPLYMFLIKTPSSGEWKFNAGIDSNKDVLEYFKGLISSFGYTLLIQDNSFLGFPAYKIFIPGMSEMFEDFKWRRSRDECMEGMHKINKSSKSQILGLIKKIERLICDKNACGVLDVAGIIVKGGNKEGDDGSIDERGQFMRCCLYYICEMYENAYQLYKEYKKGMYSVPLIYLKLKSLHYQDETIQELFSNVDIHFNAKEYFDFDFPQCPDCSLCHWKEVCKYEEWRSMRDRLASKRNQFEENQSVQKEVTI